MAYEKLLPQPTADETEAFWKAAKDHNLRLQRCRTCGKPHHYPRNLCPYCFSEDLEWIDASGRGTVYMRTIVRQAVLPGWADDVPYVFAIVELEEGPHITTNVVDCSPDEVKVGMPVTVLFEDVSDQFALVKFRPSA